MPWYWTDDDDPLVRGDIALHPTRLVDYYFDGLGQFSHRYLRNFYIQGLQKAGFHGDEVPVGFPIDSHLAQLDIPTNQILPSLFKTLTPTCP